MDSTKHNNYDTSLGIIFGSNERVIEYQLVELDKKLKKNWYFFRFYVFFARQSQLNNCPPMNIVDVCKKVLVERDDIKRFLKFLENKGFASINRPHNSSKLLRQQTIRLLNPNLHNMYECMFLPKLNEYWEKKNGETK